jgi:mRNA interferase YafQ
MRTIKRTNAFKRDYRCEKRGQYREILNKDLEEVLELLIADAIMPEQYQDHPMRGSRGRHRNCHVRPDLVLIYSKQNVGFLDLIRLGSHSELGI